MHPGVSYVYEVPPVAFLICLVASAACSSCCVHFPADDSANLLLFFFYQHSPLVFQSHCFQPLSPQASISCRWLCPLVGRVGELVLPTDRLLPGPDLTCSNQRWHCQTRRLRTRFTRKTHSSGALHLFPTAAGLLISQLLKQVSVVRGFFNTMLLINPGQAIPQWACGVMSCRSSAVP